MKFTTQPAQKAHCELCGSTDFTNVEGYTSCCNELICTGYHSRNFVYKLNGKIVKQLTACCSGKADREMHKLGIKYDDGQ